MTLSIFELQELLSYDPLSGQFSWKVSIGGKGQRGVSGRFPAGSAAGSQTQGYVRIRINKRLYFGHRLAWAFVHGSWPANNIDHIDGNPANNQIANLRDVTQQVNLQNQTKSLPRNTSGCLGVGLHKKTGKWRARITVDCKEVSLGLFDDLAKAHEAYVEAKRKLHKGCTL